MVDFKTNIEQVTYLNLADSKNNWYLDAERFDVNFPLVMTYVPNDFSPLIPYVNKKRLKAEARILELEQKGQRYGESFSFVNGVKVFKIIDGADSLGWNRLRNLSVQEYASILNDRLGEIYSVLNVSVNFFSMDKNLSVILVEGFVPNEIYSLSKCDPSKASILGGPYDSGIFIHLIKQPFPRYCSYIPEIYFMMCNWNRIGNSYYGTLAICAELDPEELRYRYTTAWNDNGFQFDASQLILTKDWDLIKKFLFFMIRNHQYEYCMIDYPYTRDYYFERKSKFPFLPDDLDVFGIGYGLPLDVRNGNMDTISNKRDTCISFYDRNEWLEEVRFRKKLEERLKNEFLKDSI